VSWKAEIEEIHRRRRLAEACGGAEAVARHHAEGRLTIRAGTGFGSDRRKGGQGGFIEDLAYEYHIPLVFFADVPGFMVGPEAEANAILREGMRARFVGLQVSVPVSTVIVRKCCGMAGGGAIDRRGLNFKIAWPSAEWGSLPLAGGVRAAYKREIEAAADPARREKETEEELRRLASPFRTAEAFAVEDLIDPRETRPYLCQFIDAAQARLKTRLGPKYKVGVRP